MTLRRATFFSAFVLVLIYAITFGIVHYFNDAHLLVSAGVAALIVLLMAMLVSFVIALSAMVTQ